MLVMWYAPFGILSLIAARLGEHSDFLGMLRCVNKSRFFFLRC